MHQAMWELEMEILLYCCTVPDVFESPSGFLNITRVEW